jgi:hypothetical protein
LTEEGCTEPPARARARARAWPARRHACRTRQRLSAIGPSARRRALAGTHGRPLPSGPTANSHPSTSTRPLQPQPDDTDSILQPRRGAVRGKTCHGPCSLASMRALASPFAPAPPTLSSSLALRRRAVFVYSAAYGSNTKGIAETISHEVRATRWAPGRQGLSATLEAAGAQAPADPGHRSLWVVIVVVVARSRPRRKRRRTSDGAGEPAAWQHPTGCCTTPPTPVFCLLHILALKSACAAGRPHPGAEPRRQERGR